MIIAMHAVLGDGTINLYEGPAGPETEKAIEAINNWCDDMAEPNPNEETMQESDDYEEPGQCDSDEDLAETLLWWANSGAPRSEWEVDTGVSTGIDLG